MSRSADSLSIEDLCLGYELGPGYIVCQTLKDNPNLVGNFGVPQLWPAVSFTVYWSQAPVHPRILGVAMLAVNLIADLHSISMVGRPAPGPSPWARRVRSWLLHSRLDSTVLRTSCSIMILWPRVLPEHLEDPLG